MKPQIKQHVYAGDWGVFARNPELDKNFDEDVRHIREAMPTDMVVAQVQVIWNSAEETEYYGIWIPELQISGMAEPSEFTGAFAGTPAQPEPSESIDTDGLSEDDKILIARAERTVEFFQRQPKEVAIGAVIGALLDAYEMGKKAK